MTTPLLSFHVDDYPRHAVSDARHGHASLEPLQLIQLEWSFRQWARITNRYETRLARRRILIIFLLVRHAGATLHEALGLNLRVDLVDQSLFFRESGASGGPGREVRLAPHLAREIHDALQNQDLGELLLDLQSLDSSSVRHEFFERADACGLPRELSSPENIRLARTVELFADAAAHKDAEATQGSFPSPRAFSPGPAAGRKPRSAAPPPGRHSRVGVKTQQNRFVGTIVDMQRDALQSQVHLLTRGGQHLIAMVTSNSAERLGLQPGRMAAVEIKAHSVSLHVRNTYANSSVDNCFSGKIIGLARGRVSWEVVVDIGGGATVCALLSAHYGATLKLKLGNTAWVAFNGFAVVLHAS